MPDYPHKCVSKGISCMTDAKMGIKMVRTKIIKCPNNAHWAKAYVGCHRQIPSNFKKLFACSKSGFYVKEIKTLGSLLILSWGVYSTFRKQNLIILPTPWNSKGIMKWLDGILFLSKKNVAREDDSHNPGPISYLAHQSCKERKLLMYWEVGTVTIPMVIDVELCWRKWYYRNTECFRLERTIKIHPLQKLCNFNWIRLLRAQCNLALTFSRNGIFSLEKWSFDTWANGYLGECRDWIALDMSNTE